MGMFDICPKLIACEKFVGGGSRVGRIFGGQALVEAVLAAGEVLEKEKS